MPRKLLIANRGEVAVRIARACRDAGVRSVAVYSEADRGALHVRLADEAEPIGPAPAAASYLRAEALLEAARRHGCDAVHPGYGFLSENAEFAAACRDAGLRFVGPPPEAIAAMGDKLRARRLMTAAGVPVVPGAELDPSDPAAVRTALESVGLPLMVKAAGGGGGKGIRLVRDLASLSGALERASSEAARAFGDPRVYLERYVEGARHVEVQVLADSRGHVVHLGERECSVQRRHQKLIEEAPCTSISGATREALHRAAVAAARAAGYVNAGTVEFLVAPGGEAWFLEMNTRLQVEHPVTEEVTGLDLVRLQLAIADGEEIPFDQDGVHVSGHAIEARVCAEDPEAGFLPSLGVVGALHLPAGPGVRVDTALEPGTDVSVHYDPMIAKLIARGRDRLEALTVLGRALGEWAMTGPRSNVPLLRRVLDAPEFRAGDVHTGWLEAWLGRDSPADGQATAELAALAAVLVRHVDGLRRHAGRGGPEARFSMDDLSPWARSGRPSRGGGRGR